MVDRKHHLSAVILAAGKGVRMRSDLPKVLHPLLRKPLVSYVIDACRQAGAERVVLVVGYREDLVRTTIGDGVEYALQKEQLGTGHALMTAAETMGQNSGDVLVLVGDAPFLTGEILGSLVRKHHESGAAATMMTAIMDPPPAYGRIVRDARGRVLRIVEERDASPEEKKITEVNTSHYCFDSSVVFPLLSLIDNNNDQKEYYLTDIIQLLSGRGELVETITVDDPMVLRGINTREELLEAEAFLKKRDS